MLPTHERRLRKKFSAAIHDLELKIQWYHERILERESTIKKMNTKILALESKVKFYQKLLLVLSLGIMLCLIF